MSTDPRSNFTYEWTSKRVRFDHQGKRLIGTIISRTFKGYRGNPNHPIPDYDLTIQGQSGNRITVSMYDTYAIVIA